ncbi:DNA alkylation repair protein [Lacisediminihabitans changchengi]|uniref:DNA alkylation repair protein n=1 Tax=Lacisediminihabitans changchengi TaxID=2787634 RepID=A0A934SJC9_9MICO|nr:DNA alkylation repair protein [Lacisediminihabitans changchengi]MBK4347706.1 DNA alkylation repair protein [Lacisediminihabitans changchengi]
MTDAAEFIDATLQREGDWYRAEDDRERLGAPEALRFYGASVGAVRGTVRDALRRHRELTHDDVTALASELWSVPVFERRLAAIVLLQTKLELLIGTDLTRIEGFIRSAQVEQLVAPLATDVLGPLLERLPEPSRSRADLTLDRWARDDRWLARAAALVRSTRAS